MFNPHQQAKRADRRFQGWNSRKLSRGRRRRPDHVIVEQGCLTSRGWPDRRADIAKHAMEAVADTLSDAGDGIKHLEIIDDGFWKVLHETLMQNHRFYSGQGRARIVKPCMDPVVHARRAGHQLVCGLNNKNTIRN